MSSDPGADHPGPIGPDETPHEHEDAPHPLQPRKPRTLGGAVYLAVLGVCTFAMLVVVLGQWRLGLALLGGAFVTAAMARWGIPESNSGMLHLRRKAIDVPTLLLIGTALIVLAGAINERPMP